MSRKSDRLGKPQAWERAKFGTNGFYAGERFATVSLRCSRCGEQVLVCAQHMDAEHNVGLEFHMDSLKGRIYEAGPDSDPTSRYAFDCGSCGARDMQARRDRLEAETASVLEICRRTDTPQTRTVTL